MIKTVGFDNITISDLSGKENQELMGKTVSEESQLRGQTAFDTLFDVLLEEEGKASMVI